MRTRPLHFIDAEVNRIVRLFNVACHINVGNAYNNSLSLTSRVYQLNSINTHKWEM